MAGSALASKTTPNGVELMFTSSSEFSLAERRRRDLPLYALGIIGAASATIGMGRPLILLLALFAVWLGAFRGGWRWLAAESARHQFVVLFIFLAWILDVYFVSMDRHAALGNLLSLQLAFLLVLVPRVERCRRMAFFLSWFVLLSGGQHGLSIGKFLLLGLAFVFTPAALRSLYGGRIVPKMAPGSAALSRVSTSLCFALLILTCVFFLVVPRRGFWTTLISKYDRVPTNPLKDLLEEAGLVDIPPGQEYLEDRKATMGSLRPELLNHKLAFSVQFERGKGEKFKPFYPDNFMFLKAITYDHYENGVWTYTDDFKRKEEAASPIPADVEMIRQRISLEGLHTQAVLGLSPILKPRKGDFYEAPSGNLKFTKVIHPPASIGVLSLFKKQRPTPQSRPGKQSDYPGIDYLQVPEAILPQVTASSKRILQFSKNPLLMAQSLERYLSNSFKYSLTFKGEENVDPVLALLTKNSAGYCMHFASSMVLMLRAGGIPARLVCGYASREWKNGRLFVRHDYAHAWPEVYFEDAGWVTFDPTPRIWVNPKFTPIESRKTPWTESLVNLFDLYSGYAQGDFIRRYTTDPNATFAFAGVAALFVCLLLWWRRRIRRLSKLHHQGETGVYHRLFELMSKFGYQRPLQMTARQFADQHRGEPFGEDLIRLTDLLESIRYGTSTVTEQSGSEMESLLKRLVATITSKGTNPTITPSSS
mgnify:FL=1